MEASNKLGQELWPAWDLLKTPLDLAGICFFYLRDNLPATPPPPGLITFLNSYLEPQTASWD